MIVEYNIFYMVELCRKFLTNCSEKYGNCACYEHYGGFEWRKELKIKFVPQTFSGPKADSFLTFKIPLY